MDTQPFSPFVNGEIRCPKCRRKRPMTDLLGDYNYSQDFFTIKGIQCSACRSTSGHTGPLWSLVTFGSWRPTPMHIPSYLNEPRCPFCGKVVVKVPENALPGSPSRDFEYVRCPGSPLIYRLAVVR